MQDVPVWCLRWSALPYPKYNLPKLISLMYEIFKKPKTCKKICCNSLHKEALNLSFSPF